MIGFFTVTDAEILLIILDTVYSKKVSTPSADTYIKINTIKIPKGPTVEGCVACRITIKIATATATLITITLLNMFPTIPPKN
jgi:hypothetical protein